MRVMEPFDYVVKARIQMLTKKGFSFFGTLCLQLPIEINDSICSTACTDGKKQFYNSDYIKHLASSDPQSVIGLVAHEVMHVALGHLWRHNGRDMVLWNKATDIVINNMLTECNMKLPKGGLFEPKYKGMSAEEVYAKLQQDSSEEERQNQSGDGDGDGEGNGDNAQPWGDHSKWNKVSAEEAKKLQGEWKKKLSQAATVARQKGDMPGGISNMVDDILHPKLDYKQALAAYIQPQMVDYTFSPPDLRYPDADFLMPDFGGEGLEDLVIAIDTSGSCMRDLPQFLAETKEILSSWNCFRLHYVQCDADIQEWLTISSFDSIPNEIKGLGGTRFTPVFNEVQTRGIVPSVLIYLTDTYGDFPNDPPNYPVLWVTGESNVEVPFGTLAYLNT